MIEFVIWIVIITVSFSFMGATFYLVGHACYRYTSDQYRNDIETKAKDLAYRMGR